MKTLANCSPMEFLVQTNKIRKQAERWLTLTKIMEIRRNRPTLTAEMTLEEKRTALQEQVQRNLSAILEAVLDEYPQETAELLCLICFIDPKDMENHTMTELLSALNEVLDNEEVVGFFTSLTRLGQMSGSAIAKA